MKRLFSNKLIIGLVILGFAGGMGLWFIISSVYLDEAGIDLTTPPSVSTSSGVIEASHRIFVNAANEIFVDDKTLNIQELKNTMTLERITDEKQRIILGLDENAKHSILIDIKETLDALGYDVTLEIIRTREDGAE